MQETDCDNVAAVFLFRAAHAEIVVRNTEVVLFIKRNFRVKCRDCLFRLRLFLLQGRHCRFFAVRFRRIARKHPVSVSPILRFVGITCSLGFHVYHVAINLPVDLGKVLRRKARIVRLRIKGCHCFRKERCSRIRKLAIRHFTDTVDESVSLLFVREISAVACKVLIGFSEYGERKRVRYKLPARIRIGIVINPIKLFSCRIKEDMLLGRNILVRLRSCLPIGIELVEIPEHNGISGFFQLLLIAVYGVFRDTAHRVSCAVCHRAGGHCQVTDFCGSCSILIEELIKIPQCVCRNFVFVRLFLLFRLVRCNRCGHRLIDNRLALFEQKRLIQRILFDTPDKYLKRHFHREQRPVVQLNAVCGCRG